MASLVLASCSPRRAALLVEAGFVGSASEAERKRKERAVKINGEVVAAAQIAKFVPGNIIVKVGKTAKNVAIVL